MKSKEILTINDIKQLVDSFYSKVREDDLLKDVFNSVIEERWPEHLEKLYRFWQTILLGEQTYFGSPFLPHANLPITGKHFERWLKLFYENIDEQFTGEKAQQAKWRADKMAQMFQSKIEYYRNNSGSPLM